MAFKNLDLDTLRTLAVANDLGGYGQAASRLGRTPSAISLQMKRLQEDIGSPLFKKHGRALALTEAGELALRFGRRMLALNDELLDTIKGASLSDCVRVGFSQDFADKVLPTVLARFARLYPHVVLEVRIEGNATLAEAVSNGQIDAALVVGQHDRPTAQVLGELDLVWIAGRDFSPGRNQPLPLILLGPQCAFRKEAVRQLDASGLAWRVAATRASFAGLRPVRASSGRTRPDRAQPPRAARRAALARTPVRPARAHTPSGDAPHATARDESKPRPAPRHHHRGRRGIAARGTST